MRIFYLALALAAGCSPLKSSPREEKHQLELTLQELRTHLENHRRDLSCVQAELQILDGRIKHYEHTIATLKQQDLDKHSSALGQLANQLALLEKRLAAFESGQGGEAQQLKQLSSHANETTAALLQFKQRILELEEALRVQNSPVAKNRMNGALYKVRPGDSLEKIARLHKTTSERIRQANQLDSDLIVVGQELCIPQG